MSQRFRVLQELGEEFEHGIAHTGSVRERQILSSWSLRSAPVLGAICALFVGAIATGLILISSSASPAYANWTAVPGEVTPAALAKALTKCYGTSTPKIGHRVLAEGRGRSVAAIFLRNGTVYMCRYDSAVPAATNDSLGRVRKVPGADRISVPYPSEGGESSGKLPRGLFRALKHGPSPATTRALTAFRQGDGYGYWMLGRVGRGVSAITLAFRGHQRVTATIQNGWYFAWWPWTTNPTTATVITRAGALTSKMASPPLSAGRGSAPLPACQPGSTGCVFEQTSPTRTRIPATSNLLSIATQQCTDSAISGVSISANAFDHSPVLTQTHDDFVAAINVTDERLYACLEDINPRTRDFAAQDVATFGRVKPAPKAGQLSLPYVIQTGFGGGGGGGQLLLHPTDAQFLARQHQQSGAGYGPYTIGRAGADVSAVTFRFANHRTVAATVKNGWYFAWWPGTSTPNSVTVTGPAGTQTSPVIPSKIARSAIAAGCKPESPGCVFARP